MSISIPTVSKPLWQKIEKRGAPYFMIAPAVAILLGSGLQPSVCSLDDEGFF